MTEGSPSMMPSGVALPVSLRDEEADAYRDCALLAAHGIGAGVLLRARHPAEWLVCVDARDAEQAERVLAHGKGGDPGRAP